MSVKCLFNSMKSFITLAAFIFYFSSFQYATSSVARDRVRRIVNGQPTLINKFPWQLNIFLDDKLICGGSIIDRRWALTAAHCVKGVEKERILLEGGNAKWREGYEYDVEEIVVHEDYNADEYKADIALLKVKRFRYSDEPFNGFYVRPVELVEPDTELNENTVVIVAGFGETEEQGKQTDVLRETSVETVNNEDCKDPTKRITILDSHLCVQSPMNSKGFCFGDDGGAILIKNLTLVGIGIAFNNCGFFNKPQICTKVSHYRDWIKEKSGV